MVIMDGKGESWEERMLEDTLGLCPPLRAISLEIPTDIQRRNAQSLPEAERREIFAFARDRQDWILKLLSAAEKSPEALREIGSEAVMDFRQRETHYSKSVDRFSSSVQMRVHRMVRADGAKYPTDIVEYFE